MLFAEMEEVEAKLATYTQKGGGDGKASLVLKKRSEQPLGSGMLMVGLQVANWNPRRDGHEVYEAHRPRTSTFKSPMAAGDTWMVAGWWLLMVDD